MSQDCKQEGDWGGCPSPVTPEFVQQVRRLLSGFVHMLEVEQICHKQIEGPHDITDSLLVQLFNELENAENLAATHHKLQNVGKENKCQGEAGRQLFLFKPNIEGFSEKSRVTLPQPTSEHLETVLTRLINSFIQEFTVRRFINTSDCSCIVLCRFCNKQIGFEGRTKETLCCDDGAFVSKIWKRLTARNSLKGIPVWDENLLTEVLDFIHNKLSGKYELFGDFQKEIDEYTKQLTSGDYEDRYVKNFIKQRLEGHSKFKTRFDGLEAKEVDTSDIFDEQPDDVHLPAGYVSVDTETNIQGHAGEIPYGYAQADTLSQLQLILNPKDDAKKKADESEYDEFKFCYKVEPGVTQTEITGETGDIPYGNARLVICRDERSKKYTDLDRNKITIDKERRMDSDSNIITDNLEEMESEKDDATKRHRKSSSARTEKKQKLKETSSEYGEGKKKADKNLEKKRKLMESSSVFGEGKKKKDKELTDKMDISKRKVTEDGESGDAKKKRKSEFGKYDESKADVKNGHGKGGAKSKTDHDTEISKSKSGKGIHDKDLGSKGLVSKGLTSKGMGSKSRGRDLGTDKATGKATDKGTDKATGKATDKGTDHSGMKGKLGRDGEKSLESNMKHKHDTDDLYGADLKNTSSRKSRSPLKNKSLKGACGIKYQLSDSKFIDIGWTILPKYPNEKKFKLYCAKPTKADKNWFSERETVEEKFYSDGTVFATCKPDGSGSVFYPNGSCAISVKICEEGTYIIAYNPSVSDITTVAAIFDTIGNGVVYSPAGKIRLIYTQQEGIFYDTPFKVPIKWHWLITGKIKDIVEVEEKREKKKEQFTEGIVKKIEKVFAIKERLASLSTKSSVAKSLISGQMSHQQFDTEKPSPKKSSTRRKSTVVPVPSWNTDGSKVLSEGELIKQEMEKNTSLLLSETSPINIVSREFSSVNDVIEKPTGHKFSPLKSIVLKINKHISLRILDQENINLQISCENQTLRLELGVHIIPEETLKEHFVDAIELNKYPVICYFELLQPPSLDKPLKLLENQRMCAAEEAIKN